MGTTAPTPTLPPSPEERLKHMSAQLECVTSQCADLQAAAKEISAQIIRLHGDCVEIKNQNMALRENMASLDSQVSRVIEMLAVIERRLGARNALREPENKADQPDKAERP